MRISYQGKSQQTKLQVKVRLAANHTQHFTVEQQNCGTMKLDDPGGHKLEGKKKKKKKKEEKEKLAVGEVCKLIF